MYSYIAWLYQYSVNKGFFDICLTIEVNINFIYVKLKAQIGNSEK